MIEKRVLVLTSYRKWDNAARAVTYIPQAKMRYKLFGKIPLWYRWTDRAEYTNMDAALEHLAFVEELYGMKDWSKYDD